MYQPGSVPVNAQELPQYLARELQAVADDMAAPLVLAPRAGAPARPQEGQVENADGTNWNPGSGAGLYYYRAGAWVFIA